MQKEEALVLVAVKKDVVKQTIHSESFAGRQLNEFGWCFKKYAEKKQVGF